MNRFSSFLIALVSLLLLVKCSADNSVGDNSGSTQDGHGGSLAVFALQGDYMYVVDDEMLNVFWIRDPANPTKVGGVQVGFGIETIFALGTNLFIGARTGMFVYDISSAENPKWLLDLCILMLAIQLLPIKLTHLLHCIQPHFVDKLLMFCKFMI